MDPGQLSRLAEAGIDILPLNEIATHFVFHRDGFVALVERTPQGFGAIGSSGVLMEGGFAVLVWRAGRPFFVARGFEKPATPEDVVALRKFAADLESSIH